MFRAGLTLFAAALLLFAQAQCAAACASKLCPDLSKNSVPPCHRHHGNSHDPASCDHQVLDAPATSPHAAQVELPSLSVVGVAAIPPAVSPNQAAAAAWYPSNLSPPAAGNPSPVLRI